MLDILGLSDLARSTPKVPKVGNAVHDIVNSKTVVMTCDELNYYR